MELTEKHFDLIAHSLGINLYNAKVSKIKKYKFLPNEFYRNYFCSSEGSEDYLILKELEEIKYTESWHQNGHVYFMVTEKGINEFKEYFSKEVTQNRPKLTKSQENYQDYISADTGMSYEDWLGITPPKREYSKNYEWVRFVSQKYPSVKGSYKLTIKEAKKSYKDALISFKKNLNDN